jgi:adenosyl cobinamide kinase/adenosyl cobinamide phosphate guanylyltransferase
VELVVLVDVLTELLTQVVEVVGEIPLDLEDQVVVEQEQLATMMELTEEKILVVVAVE